MDERQGHTSGRAAFPPEQDDRTGTVPSVAPQAHPQEEIIILTRYPRAGKVKTRLIPFLGGGRAAALHAYLAGLTLAAARELRRSREAGITLWYTGGTEEQMRTWVGGDVPLAEQRGRDLGERMAAAFRTAWAQGAERAVLAGTDCPALGAPLLAEALDHLRGCDMVIGPAHDGGYYLIGLRRQAAGKTAALFSGMTWGAADTFSRTMEQAARAGLSTVTLRTLHDIDRPEDLRHLRHHSDPQ